MKYIILAENPYTHDLETPVLFPEWITHKSVAEKFTVPVVSAGFVKITPEGVVCHGESDSLRLKPRSVDAELIEQCFGMKKPVTNDAGQTVYDFAKTPETPTPVAKKPHAFDILGLRTLP